MATDCPKINACGTTFPGWLRGTLPKEGNQDTLKVYFRNNHGDCKENRKVYIQVKNCGPYYIYYLNGEALPKTVQYRFCGTADLTNV